MINDIGGQKFRSDALSYKMSILPDKLGCKINSEDKYYDQTATDFYAKNDLNLNKTAFQQKGLSKKREKSLEPDESKQNGSGSPQKKDRQSLESQSKSGVLFKRDMKDEWLGPNQKFEILKHYFGIDCIKLQDTDGNEKR